MSEDVSATMRVGITVILVAALVATVLNLMVMSNSLLSGGQTTLQSGIDSVSEQEFATYNNTKVSGTQVNTALSLFQGRDVAILIQTKTFKSNYGNNEQSGLGPYMNYGALISSNKNTSAATPGFSSKGTDENGITDSVAGKSVTDSITGGSSGNKALATIAGSTAGSYFIVKVVDKTVDADGYLYQEQGAPNFTGLLYDKNGIVQSNANIIGCSTLGNPQYLLSSARFQSILIKDATGSIIGIAFYQI